MKDLMLMFRRLGLIAELLGELRAALREDVDWTGGRKWRISQIIDELDRED